MKLEGIKCDCCGSEITNILALRWDRKPSVFSLKFPRDGVNGGLWNMDVCASCRESIYDAIVDKITELRHKP